MPGALRPPAAEGWAWHIWYVNRHEVRRQEPPPSHGRHSGIAATVVDFKDGFNAVAQ